MMDTSAEKASDNKEAAGLPSISFTLANISASLSEITQSKNVRYAFLAGEFLTDGAKVHTFHPLVKCRDFLTDVLVSKDENRVMQVYGFEMTPAKNELVTECLQLLLEMPSKKEKEVFLKNFEAIRRLETAYFSKNIKESSQVFDAIRSDSNGSRCFVAVRADAYFQKTSYLLSLYTFWLRLSLYLKEPTDNWLDYGNVKPATGDMFVEEPTVPRDLAYMKHMKEKNIEGIIPLLCEVNLDKSPTVTGFDKNTYSYAVHDYGGIQGLLGMVENPKYAGLECYSAYAGQVANLLKKA